jgi:NhaP-type Na+/H+ or K+/H+ antiporter
MRLQLLAALATGLGPSSVRAQAKNGTALSPAAAAEAAVQSFYDAADRRAVGKLRAAVAPGWRAVMGDGCLIVSQTFFRAQSVVTVGSFSAALESSSPIADQSLSTAAASRDISPSRDGQVVTVQHEWRAGKNAPLSRQRATHLVDRATGKLASSFWYGGPAVCFRRNELAAEWEEVSTESYTSLFVAISLLMVVAAIGFEAWLQKRRVLWLPASGATMVIGLATGLLLSWALELLAGQQPPDADAAAGGAAAEMTEVLQLDQEIFVLALLPMIIFDAGYALDKRAFFRKARPILIYALLGTLVSCLLLAPLIYAVAAVTIAAPVGGGGGGGDTALEAGGLDFSRCMAFAALLSAIDPVATLAIFKQIGANGGAGLGAKGVSTILMGESVVNDAAAIVIYRAALDYAQSGAELTFGMACYLAFELCYIFVGSMLVGLAATLAGTRVMSSIHSTSATLQVRECGRPHAIGTTTDVC